MRRLRRQISNFARDHRSRVFKSLAIARVGSDVAIPAGAPLHDKQDKYRVLWHSAAHLLGAALEHRYGDACFLTNGPATADGFHYDALLLRDSAQWISHRRAEISRLTKSDLLDTQNIARAISDLLQGRYGDPKFVNQDELASIQKHMYRQASSAIPFEFAHVSREQAAVMFAYSPFKLQLVNRIPQNSLITVFKCGNFVDLCRGPHIDNASRIKAIKLLQANSTIWNGDGPQVLSRIHGIAFESDIAQKDHTLQMQEAARRNHRDVGKRQALFAFDVSSPGSPFFLPHGTRIINKLLKFIRQLYMQYDYDEVITPQLFSKSLWVQSGHWQNYKENMLLLKDGSLGDDSVGTGLKAMNCPGHCILFSMAARSYRDLPMRLAEFSPLHRYNCI